jgi:hypothetical protein
MLPSGLNEILRNLNWKGFFGKGEYSRGQPILNEINKKLSDPHNPELNEFSLNQSDICMTMSNERLVILFNFLIDKSVSDWAKQLKHLFKGYFCKFFLFKYINKMNLLFTRYGCLEFNSKMIS